MRGVGRADHQPGAGTRCNLTRPRRCTTFAGVSITAGATSTSSSGCFRFPGAVPASHIAGGYAKARSERQPPMYFRLGGGTLNGVCKPGHVVWSRVFVEGGALHVDLGRATAIELPAEETARRLKSVTPQWPIMHTLLHGISRDQFMAQASREPSQRGLCSDQPGSRPGASSQGGYDGGAGHPRAPLWRLSCYNQERTHASMLVPLPTDSTEARDTTQPLIPQGLGCAFLPGDRAVFSLGSSQQSERRSDPPVHEVVRHYPVSRPDWCSRRSTWDIFCWPFPLRC